jgi:hypothetical protein
MKLLRERERERGWDGMGNSWGWFDVEFFASRPVPVALSSDD